MDFAQKKLNKNEWEAIEARPPSEEMEILNLILAGYHNVNIKQNNGLSIITFMRINKNFDVYHQYFYDMYFKKKIEKMIKKYNFPIVTKWKKIKIKLKMADKIRIENSNSKLDSIKKNIYEFVLLSIIEKLGKKQNPLYYYTLHHLIKNSIVHLNIHVVAFIKNILTFYSEGIKAKNIIKHAQKYMEKNPIIRKWQDVQLYSHQKQLFTHCKNTHPKIILYQAPTGTGKTISPIGLSQAHKLIFVCVAKHVGLQLAKSCIALGLRIAIAFGCSDPGDIKLHYFAAKDFVKNRRTGGIFRVDNSVGDNVQIIISDVQSYLPAMRYMLAFNPKEEIIWYWDEPTITLDYEDHPYHEIMKKNWRENEIPNIVLSSATLPTLEDIRPCIQQYKLLFPRAQIYTITSYICKKSIPIINSQGYHVLPHYCYATTEDIALCSAHLKKNKTILRYFDLQEIVAFILYMNKHVQLKRQLQMENYFENPIDIDVMSIKEYYLELLFSIKDGYDEIYQYFQKKRIISAHMGIRLTTTDAHTLTDGPTIFLVDNVDRIGDFCVKMAGIPPVELNNILNNLKKNDKLYKQITSLQQHIEAEKESKQETQKSKELKGLYGQIRPIRLDRSYVPNSFSHLRKWASDDIKNAFTSEISEEDVERIVSLPIREMWKILLLMGIGVFKKHDCVFYSEIMKKLAAEQKLYLIIASTDYIYGTNYQFCHGYLGKDLADMTQEKIIQAFGRIGRANAAHNYSIRLRDDTMIDKLLKPCEFNREVENMNRLFGI
jgi:hypothetical protein